MQHTYPLQSYVEISELTIIGTCTWKRNVEKHQSVGVVLCSVLLVYGGVTSYGRVEGGAAD